MEKSESLKNKEWELLWGVRRSVRYHMRRCRFFDTFHAFTSFVGVFAGSGAAVTYLWGKHPDYATIGALSVAIMSSIDLVVGTGPKARLHNELAKRFIELEKEMTLAHRSLTEESIEKFTAERLEIEADEPPILRTLDLLCHNELARAMGIPESSLVRIGPLKKIFANLISFDAPVKA